MYNNKTFLAIIPARGGSKRLPRKNILDLGGKPLITWSIEAAIKSKYIDNLVVSSDDDEILSISAQHGAEVLKRPKELASDTASTFDVLQHVIQSKNTYDYIILLQPTSPFRDEQDIDGAIEYLFNKEAQSVVSVCEMEHSILWSNTLPSDNDMSSFLKDDTLNKRSQDLQTYYRLNGAIYICKSDLFLKNGGFFLKENIYAYIMQQYKSIDIDTKIDFDFAQFLINQG